MNVPAKSSANDSARSLATYVVNEIRAFRFIASDPVVVDALHRSYFDEITRFPESLAFVLPALREVLDDNRNAVPSPREVLRLARCRTHGIPSERESVFVLRSLISQLRMDGARSFDEADERGRLGILAATEPVVEAMRERARAGLKADAVVREQFAASGDADFERWFDVYFALWCEQNPGLLRPTRLDVFGTLLLRSAAKVLTFAANEFGLSSLAVAVLRSDSVVLKEWRTFYGERVDEALEEIAATASAP